MSPRVRVLSVDCEFARSVTPLAMALPGKHFNKVEDVQELYVEQKDR